jgi:hypothetical protein
MHLAPSQPVRVLGTAHIDSHCPQCRAIAARGPVQQCHATDRQRTAYKRPASQSFDDESCSRNGRNEPLSIPDILGYASALFRPVQILRVRSIASSCFLHHETSSTTLTKAVKTVIETDF